MKLTFAILASLCLSVPVFSQSTCKTIAGAANFNFVEYIPYEQTYVMGIDTPELRHCKCASETSVKVGNQYFTSLAVTKFDGTQSYTNITKYLIQSVQGATFKKVVLKNGVQTDMKFTKTIYFHKPKEYTLFYVCGSNGSDQDLRFAVLFGNNNTLNDNLKQEMLDNDAKFGFKGNLVPFGDGSVAS